MSGALHSTLTLRVKPAGLRVITLWITLFGGILIFLFASGWWIPLLFGLWLLFSVTLPRLLYRSFRLTVEGGDISLHKGTFFPTEGYCRVQAVTSLTLLSTPLLHSSGSAVVLLRTPGLWYLLPPLDKEDINALRQALRG